MYDYLTTITADYNSTLSISPQEVVAEMLVKNQIPHLFDDGSERVISLDDDCIFQVQCQWTKGITANEAGEIVSYYADSNKANGIVRSFYWTHPTDGHVYTVKFRSQLQRTMSPGLATKNYQAIDQITLKVIGRHT
jgi:hypothetical protein